ncbi:MAG: DNA polymerase III subunit alpha [Candidatus Buchananbacteria bacterium CG10_big_fil_rev_8_21_14_0_10_42_9]|uniref:DNA-directed DNA polymerase n=1 Tax=Candidatus Buchananbacteria bacterium CG10_big_fil_rev_8_21_14_0_10_42_9 TaxID=1974526 RepID=A0A2H0W4R1_9BACT|nr:MAG: DNA polymerase III subunit alpha [Candidatus Buchananbacteria bacterium CG10_big_fil_rev_8_21_14_0_10_42_9]
MSFVHLHTHSHFSLLDGLTKIDQMVAKAKASKMPALALTDHGVLYGAIDFYKKTRRAGIKPIIGVEAYVAPNQHTDKRPKIDTNPYHIILLAKNYEGYKNLVKLVSISHLQGYYYKPRIDWELLQTHHQGLIALSGCLVGQVARLILDDKLEQAIKVAGDYRDLFGEGNYYLEVQKHPNLPDQQLVNDGVKVIGKKLGIPIVATVDSHYCDPDDNLAHDIELCIQTKKLLSDKDRMSFMGDDFSLKTPEQVKADWPDNPEYIKNTLKIADQCDLELKLGGTTLPEYPLPDEVTADAELRRLCDAGAQYRYGVVLDKLDPNVKGRLNYELTVIANMGFASYFLIVQDFINWAKDQGIVVGPGRGSAAGSLVAYLTRITDIDPIKYDLLFERFLNPERVSMPDIDTDFSDTRRDEVLRYVEQKYGQDHVAQIITFGTMAARAAIRDVGRVLGLPYSYCDRAAKLIPMGMTLEEATKRIPEVKALFLEADGRKLIENAKRLEGCVRHASTHACGVVVTKKPVDEYCPRQFGTDEGSIVTQYEMHAIEDLGLLKIDFLGLKNLTLIENTLEILHQADRTELTIEEIPLEDKKTFDLLQRGETTGVFQLESSGMRRYLKMLRPTELEDIIAMVSLYRPGPMELIPDYIAGKHGLKVPEYLDPKLKPILEKTYGIAVYQEQVMEIARKLAGFSYAEADVLRKAVGKKIAKLLKEQEKKMIDGMVENKIKESVAKKIWEFILPFARYGFNRSHAACYAMIAYRTAYLKAHYPTAFMASLLTADQHDVDRISVLVEECRQMDIEVLPPDINQSFSTFTSIYAEGEPTKTIRFGLGAVKNVGDAVIREIIKERKEFGPYKDLVDFLSRVKSKDLNKKSLTSLIQSGCLDSFGERNALLLNIDKMLQFIKTINQDADSNQISLFGMMADEASLPTLNLDEVEPATDKQKLAWEKELLGLYISAHPLKEFAGSLEDVVTPISQIMAETDDPRRSYRVAAVINTSKRITTKKGDPMLFAKVEDMSSSIEVLVFPTILQQNPSLWEDDSLVIMNCRVSDKDGELKLICASVEQLVIENIESVIDKLDQAAANEAPRYGNSPTRSFAPRPKTKPSAPAAGQITISAPSAMTAELADRMKRLFCKYPGDYQVNLIVTQNDEEKRVATNYRVNCTLAFKDELESLIGDNDVIIEEGSVTK